MDVVDPKTRSRMMAGIRGKNTRPELIVRKFLFSKGFRFRLYVADLPGRPDIVLPKYKLCIFVHGCFWHRHTGCRYATTPKTRPDFWIEKLSANKVRDDQMKLLLLDLGWRVLEIWECGLKKHEDGFLSWLPEHIKGKTKMLSWPVITGL